MPLAGSARGTSYRNLTAEEAKEQLARPVFHVLTGSAFVCFPLSSPSAPSKFALFQWNSNRSFAYDGSLPIRVNGRQYHEAVRPVLLDPKLRADVPINNILLCQGPNVQIYIDRIAHALCVAFEAAGY